MLGVKWALNIGAIFLDYFPDFTEYECPEIEDDEPFEVGTHYFCTSTLYFGKTLLRLGIII